MLRAAPSLPQLIPTVCSFWKLAEMLVSPLLGTWSRVICAVSWQDFTFPCWVPST